MRCKNCGYDVQVGLLKCPKCNSDIHYWGKTQIIAGVEQSSLSIIDIFDGTFSKHIAGAGDRMFIAGTPLTTPEAGQMLQEWEKPWLYARVLIIGAIFLLLGFFMYTQLQHPAGYFVMSIIGSLLVPLSIVIFYWEINIPRDIPLYKIFIVFFIGGMLSLIFTVILPQFEGGAHMAPFSEEPAKIIALAIFLYMIKCRYIFGGLLVGAAVGAGFAAFEDIWYVMKESTSVAAAVAVKIIIQGIEKNGVEFLTILAKSAAAYFSGNTVDGAIFISFSNELLKHMPLLGENVFLIRAGLTLGGHVTWAAIEGGALMVAKGKEPLQLKHFGKPLFLGYVTMTMLLHFLWNYIPSVVSYLILTAIAVWLAFTLIKKAIAQVLLTVNSAPPQYQNSFTPVKFMLNAVAGPLSGAVFELKMPLTVGRDPDTCNIIFPPNTLGISRRHCIIETRNDGVYIMDLNSSQGTFLQGQRLSANKWYKITGNICLGSNSVIFTVNSTPY